MSEKKIVRKHNKVCVLFDYYGNLLTKRKQEILKMSYENDMSLSEIAETLSISRQAVHDNVQQGIMQLEEYEEKLKMFEKDQFLLEKIDTILADNADLQGTDLGEQIDRLREKVL